MLWFWLGGGGGGGRGPYTVIDYLGKTARPRGDDRYPGGKPLRRNQSEPFPMGRHNQNVDGGQDGRNVRPVAKPLHPRRVSQDFARRSPSRTFPAMTSHAFGKTPETIFHA